MTVDPGRLSIFVYTDEDVTARLAVLLRERGHEAASAESVGTKGLSDEDQLAFAASRGWALLTYNKGDFVRLARTWFDLGREHAGIVLSRQFSAAGTGELLRQTCNLIERVSARDMWNTVRDLQSYR